MSLLTHKLCIILGCFLWLSLTSCQHDITEFGFDGAISGTIKDQAGNAVAGNITTNGLIVQALADGDKVAIILRVKGDGTFQNARLTPKKHRIWVTGPVTMTSDTLRVDFSSEKVIRTDFVVTPFLTVNKPALMGSPTSSSVAIGYSISGNNGKIPSTREVYCSTNPYPDASTGTGPFYDTKRIALSTNSGTATITGLAPATTYYLRIGAQATGASSFNYSDQLFFTTP
jgi:hypothetical protein